MPKNGDNHAAKYNGKDAGVIRLCLDCDLYQGHSKTKVTCVEEGEGGKLIFTNRTITPTTRRCAFRQLKV